MRQKTFAEAGFEKHRKRTRREQFLDDMDRVVPWTDLCAVIEPFYPRPSGAGRRPVGLERMLRIHFEATLVQSVGSCCRRGAL